jgi:patatin-like phospholipase/acyl hydrolase
MKPFRKHVAISIDGGGIKGVIATKALAILEEHLGKTAKEVFRLAAGTSTGSIISAGIASGLSAAQMFELYVQLGTTVMAKSWRSAIWPLTRFRYPLEPLAEALKAQIGDRVMGDFDEDDPPTDVIIPCFDLVENRSRFIKPYKSEYKNWPVVTAVLASSSVPTYFPPVEGRYVDGGVGSYTNPCYLAAYEIAYRLNWDLAETTLISLGTGRDPKTLQAGDANRFMAWEWVGPILGAFLTSAQDQQVHLVRTFFDQLDFRRFQVDTTEAIGMDDTDMIPLLAQYGEKMGQMILNDQDDQSMMIMAEPAPVKY